MPDCHALVAAALAAGDLHAARARVLSEVTAPPSVDGVSFLTDAKRQRGSRQWGICNAQWAEHVDNLIKEKDHLSMVAIAHEKYYLGDSTWACHTDAPMMWTGGCCSHFTEEASSCEGLCCGIGSGDDALELPLLHEPSIHILFNTSMGTPLSLRIEQFGFLRPYDTSTVLWPAGYLLARWVASITPEAGLRLWPAITTEACGFGNEQHRRVIELGCGTGVASIAAAKYARFSFTLATDAAARALVQTTANAALNGVHASMRAQKLDWLADESVGAVAAEHGTFDLVLGAALQFETWEMRRWSVLRRLTHPGSIVALAHTTGALRGPEDVDGSGFVELERISGLAFGLHTRWSQNDADFEIVLLRRDMQGDTRRTASTQVE